MIENYKISVSGFDFKYSSKFAFGLRKKMPKRIIISNELIRGSDKYIVCVEPFSFAQADLLVRAWNKVMPGNLEIKMEKL